MARGSRCCLRFLFLTLALALVSDGAFTRALAQSRSLAELFQKGKSEFKIGSYRSSLETFNALEELSRQPGNERDREKLGPIIAFYRGANLAALGEEEAAKKEFEDYLASFPAAALDRLVYPKSVIEAFERAREQVQARKGEGSLAGRGTSEEQGIAATYARFEPPADSRSTTIDERWVAGPMRYLMTKPEKAAWERIRDPVERAEFVSKFWQRRDPDPLTPENEFRAEFEKRIAFADTHFTVSEIKGSETDRGLVFALLGPPTYIGQTPLTMQDDPVQVARAAPVREITRDSRGRQVVNYVERFPLTAQVIQGTREVWHYRRDRLQRSIQFNEVNFEFITKEGYGTCVLQRDHLVVLALEEAARAIQNQN